MGFGVFCHRTDHCLNGFGFKVTTKINMRLGIKQLGIMNTISLK